MSDCPMVALDVSSGGIIRNKMYYRDLYCASFCTDMTHYECSLHALLGLGVYLESEFLQDWCCT